MQFSSFRRRLRRYDFDEEDAFNSDLSFSGQVRLALPSLTPAHLGTLLLPTSITASCPCRSRVTKKPEFIMVLSVDGFIDSFSWHDEA